jgi:hypothetical protein
VAGVARMVFVLVALLSAAMLSTRHDALAQAAQSPAAKSEMNDSCPGG